MPISSAALAIPRSGIRDVFDRVEQVPDAISLTVGEPSATAAPHIVEAACEAARAGHTRYTNVLGIPEYRQAVADYSARMKGISYDPEREIQAVDGATIGLYLALAAVVAPGDEVIIPSPYFTSYDAEVMLVGGRPVTVALRPENGMRINAADIEAAITPRTRAVIINSPGNPTGAVTSAAEMVRIAGVCKRHNIWAISDEVYHPFVFDGEESGVASAEGISGDAGRGGAALAAQMTQVAQMAQMTQVAPSIAAVPGMKERTIVVESLSKTYAMTGWRIGYLLAPERVIEETGKIAELMHSSVNSLSQYAGVAAMAGPQDHVDAMREEYRAKRQIVLDGLAGCPVLRLIRPQGAFYAFVDVRLTGLDSDEFSRRLLDEERVAVVPGEAFGEAGRGFVRLSYAGDADELREGVARLRAFAERVWNPVTGRHSASYHPMAVMA
ncbi:aspartate aminotransferase [Bifidobacterium sp. UTCIF-3]|uniref:pyridoxal phosphate-dependent aminotransferase n=1 Tax=unclassified Bifidobacterium TaxID=2608897 RepID=UPI0011262FBA|nr:MULTISPECIES: pyridoxal phosphate-dependent aminotransferase [unclassified Bifidobacterium]TPF77891.1 aspartate aminotransferase [Bifidobacterium sp. UTCIF-1]TPF81613.1 aspartate aminotransferase [Bifidobacterium sp. UTCIF-3]TPF93072.1 aspartate aminotransferase [Bifidobacterium sp. UTBIF-68]